MSINIKQNYDELSIAAAKEIVELIKEKPNCMLGLATGNTPLGLYSELVRMNKNGEVDFSQVRALNLDEYFGISLNHPGTCNTYLEEHLYRHVNIDRKSIFRLNSEALSGKEEGLRYEKTISENGGIDILILGIGRNGHLGFNEPGTPFETTTHIAKLTDITKVCNMQLFGSVEQMPDYGITMGIKTIMMAKKCILLANGENKAEIIHKALHEKITPEVPASILQLHQNVSVILDSKAAAELA